LCFEYAHDNMVLAALPPIVVVGSHDGPNEPRLTRIVDAIRDELERDQWSRPPSPRLSLAR
jgi:hypothetical protein